MARVTMLPVCECGQIIRNLELDQPRDGLDKIMTKEIYFTPSACPYCGKQFTEIVIDSGYLIKFK